MLSDNDNDNLKIDEKKTKYHEFCEKFDNNQLK